MDHGGADVCYCRLTHVCEGRYARREFITRGTPVDGPSTHAAFMLLPPSAPTTEAPATLFSWEPRSAITEIRYIEVRYCEGLLYILQAQQIRITVKDMEIMHKTVQIKLQIISIIVNSS